MVQDNFGVVADLNARALHIAELSGKSNLQLGKYPARSAARRTARPCVHVHAPYYPSLFLPSFIASRAAGNIRCRRNIVIGGEFHIFLLANSRRNGKYIGRPIIADATGQGGNPAREASRFRDGNPSPWNELNRARRCAS